MSQQSSENQDDEYRAFLARGEVRQQRCSACGRFRPPSSWVCPECLSEAWGWEPVSGKGTVEAFVWYLQSFDERFTHVPYNVALVRLDEGVRVMGNVNAVAFGELSVGQQVVADIGTGFQGRVTLNFRPA
ncbi:MAG: OB-fold domain-containing protein [Burkholderiaceae bacterium]|nr:OB-fold domain-containing protein [Burkholderiaceae bacterium]